MEKKFKCKDEVIVRLKEPGCSWFYGVVSHSDDASVVLSGGFRHPYKRYDVLPYFGNEHLVGTTDEPEEEITIEIDEYMLANDCFDRLSNGLGSIVKFRRVDVSRNSIVSSSLSYYNYCIPMSKYNINELDTMRKEILTVRNGKLVKENLK